MFEFNETIIALTDNHVITETGRVYRYFDSEYPILIGLVAIDGLNFSNYLDFSVIFDSKAPEILQFETESSIWNGNFVVNATIHDFFDYHLSITCVGSSSGIVYSDFDYSIIQIEGDLWQIILDTNQLDDGFYNISIIATDSAGNEAEKSINNLYFDNSAPEFAGLEDNIIVDDDLVYATEIAEIIYFNDKKYLNLSALDEAHDGFSWLNIDPDLYSQDGIESILMYYTNPLAYHPISIVDTLNYETLTYEISGFDGIENDTERIKLIKSIRMLNVSGHLIDKFTVLMSQDSLMLTISEDFRYLLSPENTDDIQAEFYEMKGTMPLAHDGTNSIWRLKSPGKDYFNVSSLINVNQEEEFLFWFELEDGANNVLISRKFKGIYDSEMGQEPPGTSLFKWNLGKNSTGAGIILFGSDNCLDNTIQLNITSIIPDGSGEMDVSRVMFFGSENGTNFEFLGRAIYSGTDTWSYYWNDNLLESLPPDNYQIKALLFDKSGNYLIEITEVAIFDFSEIELLTDLVFGDIFEFDVNNLENVNNISGIIENYLDDGTELWDVVAQYYNVQEKEWIPLYTDPTTIVSHGNSATYTITWDVNQDANFTDSMCNFTYEYLPLQVTPLTDSDIWGSWGKFYAGGEWQPILVSNDGSNIDVTIYEFNEENGWVVDSNASVQDVTNNIEGQVFKLDDIDGDNIDELIRFTTSRVDVIFLDENHAWNVKENIITDYNCLTFDLLYDEDTDQSLITIIQQNYTSSELFLFNYYFDPYFNLTFSKKTSCMINFVPTSIKILKNSILIGGLIKDSCYSQLLLYDFNLNLLEVTKDLILGKVSVIEFDEINGQDTIILGINRLFIGKMDAVMTLKLNSYSEEWEEYEISGFEGLKFKIYDILVISEENAKRLIVSSNTGLFETAITYTEDKSTIRSPVCFKTEVHAKSRITQKNSKYYLSLDNYPISSVQEIWYLEVGETQWQVLNSYYYEHSKFEVKLELDSITFEI